MSPILLLVALLVFLYFIYSFMFSKPTSAFPPGPLRLPVVGGFLQLLLAHYKYPHEALDLLRKRYNSPIIGMYLGDTPMVIAHTYDTCKEIMTRPEFQGRVDGLVPRTRAMGAKLGIFFDDGTNWLHQRRYCLRKLRDLGFGRRSDKFEQVVEEEVADCMRELRVSADSGESFVIPDFFYPILLNCINHLMLGSRLPYAEREHLKDFGRMLMRFENSTNALGRMVSVVPLVKFMPNSLTGFEDLKDTSNIMWKKISEEVAQHKKTLDKEVHRDFLDAYLADMEDIPEFSEEQLIMCAIDMIFPVAVTIGALSIATMYIIENPEVLAKCQKEIDDVVGRGRLPTLCDRANLPYVEATLRETLRKTPVAPLGVVHRSTENTKYFGYDIPKDTIMVTNLHSLHNDEKLWTDPENFRPERFLDHQGQLKKKDYSLPFGLGKRVCAGETFSRHIMFLMLAGMFQNFNFYPDTKVDMDKLVSGFILNPLKGFQVKVSVREDLRVGGVSLCT